MMTEHKSRTARGGDLSPRPPFRYCSPLHGSRGEGAGVRLRRAGALFLALLLASACSNDKVDTPIYLGASPASLLVGESIVVEVTASEEFFSADVTQPMASEGGLTLDSLTVEDATHALVSISSTAETVIGAHRFTLTDSDAAATLDVSVLAEPAGPGTVTAEGNTATAGASNATLTIWGEGTHFDAAVTAEVIGADGFEIVSLTLQTEAWIEIRYSIALDQEPVEAVIAIYDGMLTYEVPFTILSPLSLQSTVVDQALTKGRVGLVTFANSDASLNAGTTFAELPSGVESGSAQVTSEAEVQIPVRVPVDFAGDSIALTAYTYSEGGAVLELITADVAFLEAAWLEVKPSRLTAAIGAQEVAIEAHGIDLTGVESLALTGDGISLVSWAAASATDATATLAVTADATVDGYVFTADEGQREVYGLVVYPGLGVGVFPSEASFPAGDHAFVALALVGGDLAEGDAVLACDGAFEVIGLQFVDPGSVIAELSSSSVASPGLETLTLSSGGEEYDVHIAIVESGL